MAQESSAAKKMTFAEQLKPIRERLAGSEEKPALELVPKFEGPKTVQEAEALLAEEGLTQGEKTKITQVSEIAAGSPEASPKVAESEKVAVTKLSGAKQRRSKGIKAVIQKEGKATGAEKEAKEVIDPVVEIRRKIEEKRSKKSMGKEGKATEIEIAHLEKRLQRYLKPKDEQIEEIAAPAEVPQAETSIEKPVTPVIETSKLPEIPKDPVEALRTELEANVEKFEAMSDRSADQEMLLGSWKKKLKDFNAKHPIGSPVEEAVEMKLESPPPKESAPEKDVVEERPEGRISGIVLKEKPVVQDSKTEAATGVNGVRFTASRFGGIRVEPRLVRSLRVAEKTATPEPVIAEEAPKSGEREAAAAEKKLSPEEIKAKIIKLAEKAEDLFLSPEEMALEDPEAMLGEKKKKFSEIIGDIIKEPEEFGLSEEISGLEDALNEYFKLLVRLGNKTESVPGKKAVMKAEKIRPEDYAYHSKELRQVINRLKGVVSEEVHPVVEEPVKKPEVMVEVKETTPVEPVVEKSKVVEAEPEKTEAKASAMAEDRLIPEYRSSLLYAKKKDQLESRLAGIKNLPVDEWSETYGEPGGFDQALWEQLKQGKDKNEKKRFQELEYNQAEYSIKELETHERLKAIRYGLGERVKILEDEHPTDERREDLERQITELQQAEKAAYLEIRGIEDMRNKDKAEEKGLFISAQERVAEAAKKAAASKTPSVRVAAESKTPDAETALKRAVAPLAPGQFEEEEKLVAGLFEINDKIKQVEKALQAQRELMPRSVLARGMGLEGSEEALKNADKIMKQHKVIRALEDQLSDLEDQKDILTGKKTETGQETKQETKIEENALIKEWKKYDSTDDQGGKSASKAGGIAKKVALGSGVGVGLGAVGALGAFVKFQYWARWQAPLRVLEFLMKVTGDPGGVLTKSISSVEKSATKFLDKKSKKETNKE